MAITVSGGRRFDPAVGDGFVDNVTKPVWRGTGNPANNVGCYYAVARTTVSSYAEAAALGFTNLNVPVQLTNTVAGNTWTNCRFTYSHSADTTGGLFYQMASATNGIYTNFVRCEFEPTTPGDRYNAFYGHDVHLYRCAITKTVDGLGIYNSTASNANVWVDCCWSGWMAWVSDDYNPGARANGHSDGTGTHNDIGGQHGSGTNVRVNGSVLNGAKYNIVNPGNVVINPDESYTITTGGADAMSESNPTEKMGPWAGQAFLSQHSAYFHVSNIELDHNWIFNFNNGIKFLSNRSSSVSPEFASGNSPITGISIHDNIFGGRWKDWGGSHHYYPIRYDTLCEVNGVTRGAAGAYADTANNVWAADANLIATTYGDTGTAIAGNPVRHRVD